MINDHSHPARFWLIAVGFCAVIFAAIAPTLTWLEFSNSAEALNVTTALEIRRSGNWLIPTLQGQPRLAKPPLTAWITALTISDQTMREISSTSAGERENGFQKLAWQTRWPALLSICLMLLATAEMGRLIAGPSCGLLAMLMAGTSFLFLRFSRYSTTDVQLALWVTLANVLLLHAIINRKLWLGFVGGGIALGLAMMSKGPVSLVQTLLPIGIWLAINRAESKINLTKSIRPILAGLFALIVIGFSWFAYILRHDPSAWHTFYVEVTREGATESKPGAWYSYFGVFIYLAPWTAMLIAGLIVAARRRKLLPIFLFIAPIIVMSFVKDRNERYLLPMLAPAAVIAAIGALPASAIVIILTWIILALIAVGFPIATMFLNPPWYSSSVAISFAIVGGVLILIGIISQRRLKGAFILFGVIVMLAMQAFFIAGYRNTREGRAELKPMAFAILDQCPDAEIYNAHPRGKRPPPELGVYLNRVLWWTDKPAEIQPGLTTKVLLIPQDKGEPAPQLPQNWRTIGHWARDKDQWWAFALAPARR